MTVTGMVNSLSSRTGMATVYAFLFAVRLWDAVMVAVRPCTSRPFSNLVLYCHIIYYILFGIVMYSLLLK